MINHPFSKDVNVPQLSQELINAIGELFVGITVNDTTKIVHLVDGTDLALVDQVIEAHTPGSELLVKSESERLTALEDAFVEYLLGNAPTEWADMMLAMGRITQQTHDVISVR